MEKAARNPLLYTREWGGETSREKPLHYALINPPFTSTSGCEHQTTMAEETGSNCKMTLFLSSPKVLNVPHHLTGQQLKEHMISYQVSPSKHQKVTSTTFILSTITASPPSHPVAFMLSKKALIPHFRFIWSMYEMKIAVPRTLNYAISFSSKNWETWPRLAITSFDKCSQTEMHWYLLP